MTTSPAASEAPEIAPDDAEVPDPALDAILAPLRAKHGELLKVAVGDVTVWCRRVPRPEYKRYRAAIFDEKRRDAATEQLATSCVVHPDRAAFQALLERLPALADTVGSAILESAGATKADAGKA